MILVVGATGMAGSEVCGLLAARGNQVRALVRPTADASKVDRLRALGAEIVQGDLRDAASLEMACRGAQRVVSTASSMPFAYVPDTNTPGTTDRDGILGLVAAASGAGVEHFVYTSFPPGPAESPLQDAKRAVERALVESGLRYTILQPTFFMEAWLSPMAGFDAANRKATIYGEGKNPISWISFRDVAQFLVASLTNDAARNAILPVGGPESLSPLQVVEIFERVGGRPWEVAHVPAEALEAQRAAASDPFAKTFAALMLAYAAGFSVDTSGVLRDFPLRLTSVEEYARQVCAATPAAQPT